MPYAAESRRGLLAAFFPDAMPTLWCPLLTHYDANGAVDRTRMAAHLRHVARHVKGVLVPGSTGDGWELSDAEAETALAVVLGEAHALRLHVLIGLLKPDHVSVVSSFLALSQGLLAPLAHFTPAAFNERLRAARVCGFAVCPPHGSSLTPDDLQRELAGVLELGLPTALYQLPQVTQNEMTPPMVAALARRFPNFIMFKDSSGTDAVALARHDYGGVVFVRGAEGDYARWLRNAGGAYDGFLLSTANCLAAPLAHLAELIAAAEMAQATQLSERLTALVNEEFDLVKGLEGGNAFANANKAMDHFFAFGPRADDAPPPRLHCGRFLPVAIIQATGDALKRHGFMPTRGYLE
jgi:dihydrodipicolinate synthase/N-acetylneuraminate lyase